MKSENQFRNNFPQVSCEINPLATSEVFFKNKKNYNLARLQPYASSLNPYTKFLTTLPQFPPPHHI